MNLLKQKNDAASAASDLQNKIDEKTKILNQLTDDIATYTKANLYSDELLAFSAQLSFARELYKKSTCTLYYLRVLDLEGTDNINEIKKKYSFKLRDGRF